jgi:uncharacterized protein (DUF2461 family)
MFTRKTLEFLQAASQQHPEWLSEHKPEYVEHVQMPQRRLLEVLKPVMEMKMPGLSGSASRLVPSMRFKRGPVYLKESIWVTFQDRTLSPEERPAFFFELYPNRYRVGMGFYQASVHKMDRIRERIDQHPDQFEKLTQLAPGFLLQGDMYKRDRAAHLPASLANWYNRKSFWVETERPIDEIVFSDRLDEWITESWFPLIELYQFIRKA